MKIELPIFGKIKLAEQKGKYKYEANIEKYNLEGNPIDLDIHFKEVNETKISKVSSVLNDLSKIHEIGKDFIQTDFEEGEIVKEYIQEWNEHIFDDERNLKNLLNRQTKKEALSNSF
jgi:hypothetical protein